MNHKLYYAYSEYLKETYGEKVYKLPINLPITCPNRLHGKGGCSFCAEVGTGFEARENTLSVTEQLNLNREHIEKKYHAHKFIAYFQNYTNTWMNVADFRSYINEAAQNGCIVEISISTRPDCIKKEYLEILKEAREAYGINITIELGLQTVNYHTLSRIDRGHGLAAFIAAVLLIEQYSFQVCTHIILNLPYDTMEDVKETVDILSSLPIGIVKIHSLYIPKNTKLSYEYEHGIISSDIIPAEWPSSTMCEAHGRISSDIIPVEWPSSTMCEAHGRISSDIISVEWPSSTMCEAHGRIRICSSDEYIRRLVYFIGHLRPDIVVERLFSRIPEENSVFSNWGKSWWVLMEEWKAAMVKENCYQGKYYIPANESAFQDAKEIGW